MGSEIKMANVILITEKDVPAILQFALMLYKDTDKPARRETFWFAALADYVKSKGGTPGFTVDVRADDGSWGNKV